MTKEASFEETGGRKLLCVPPSRRTALARTAGVMKLIGCTIFEEGLSNAPRLIHLKSKVQLRIVC